MEKFPTRESFGEMVEAELNAGTSQAKVSHWACCRETHQDGGSHFRTAVHNSIRLGCGKFRNVILVGPSNCGKKFMFRPLANIYGDDVFENPANHKFCWVGADKATILMLQDFRWSKDLVTWKDLLLFLEGEKVKFPAPRNLFRDDVYIYGNVAIFATSRSEIKCKGTYNSTDNQEDEMMRSRWRVFNFKHVFREKDQKQVEACGVCFANFILG